MLSEISSIVVLTGAGISAESGLSTFRDKDGIWAKVDYREVATPEGFARNPAKVHEFYNWRRGNMANVHPNAAHFALAQLEQEFRGDFLLVTQNIDELHERAGSGKLIHMHGEHAKALCASCDAPALARGPFGRARLPGLRDDRLHAAGRGLVRRDALSDGRNICRALGL
jgi:NAD-dependent deacetylase